MSTFPVETKLFENDSRVNIIRVCVAVKHQDTTQNLFLHSQGAVPELLQSRITRINLSISENDDARFYLSPQHLSSFNV